MDLSRSRFSEWLAQPSLDADLKEELLAMAEDPDAIEDAFGCELQFGTGGLRGILGAGTNRMNVHVVRRAAQATADVLTAASAASALPGRPPACWPRTALRRISTRGSSPSRR